MPVAFKPMKVLSFVRNRGKGLHAMMSSRKAAALVGASTTSSKKAQSGNSMRLTIIAAKRQLCSFRLVALDDRVAYR